MNEKTAFRKCLSVLPRHDLSKVLVVVIFQSLLSILDLVGIALIGLLGALTVTGVQSKLPNGTLAELLSALGISDFPLQRQAAILGTLAGVLLISKTFFAIIFTRRTFRFLSNRSAVISSRLLRKFLSQPVTSVSKKTSQDTIYSLTQGVNNITLGVIGNSVSVVSDTALILVLFAGLFALDPMVASSTVVFFAGIGSVLYLALHNKALKLGEAQAKLNIESDEKISEMVFSFREMFAKGRRSHYSNLITGLRFKLSGYQAEATFLPFIGKYVIETAVILGVLVISAAQFALSDATDAVATLSVFLAASTRIAPAILRLQQGGIQIKSAIGSSMPTLQLVSTLETLPEVVVGVEESVDFEHLGFSAQVELKSVAFHYPESSNYVIDDVNIEVSKGEFLAIVGESGAGKSTLADLILGLLIPQKGNVVISGLSPADAVKNWPGSISYVPQNSFIANASILENITLGYSRGSISPEMIENSITMSRLKDFVDTLPLGLETIIGESGSRVSGGQRQRIGIARALCSNPKLMILDEATSALDGGTEAEIASAILSLKNSVTLIVIAHRLSTIKEADRIVFLDGGKVKAVGTFEDLRKNEPKFDAQASQMGL